MWGAMATALLSAFAITGWGQTGASLLRPAGVAYDSAGNMYFADTNRNQVVESTLSGALVVVAGSGAQGFAGDGGAAAIAELNRPEGVAVGADGTLYIADTGNQRVRVVSGGVIATLVGTGAKGFSGDGGAATVAMLNEPVAVAIDASGALLICDSGNERVRRVAAGVIATIAGSGVQGFAGDGGVATAAELDLPGGLAASSDGRVFVADTHNNRVRLIATDGTISTFAGNGVRGFAGDGGSATAAELALPRGLVTMPDGALLIADENNQRVRMVSATGAISTVAGNGVQGASNDGTVATAAPLNLPRAVSVSAFAEPAVVDTANKMLRVVAPNANVYVPAGLSAARNSAVTLSLPTSAVYGQASANVQVKGSVGTPLGMVSMMDGGSALAQGTLVGGAVAISLQGLGAGAHTLTAIYEGDGLNPSAVSSASGVTISPSPVVATADGVSLVYGQTTPALTGMLTGVLPQDSGNVIAVFTTTAPNLAPVGMYAITAALQGSASANYAVTMSAASGSLKVVQAQSSVAEQVPAQSYAGLPMILNAQVAPAIRGTPTGTVTFVESGNVVASGALVGAAVSATYLAPTAGTHTVVAMYGGDGNFLPSQSSAASVVSAALPDFTVAVQGSSSQTVQGGLIATYSIAVNGQGAFSGAVAMSAGGVPQGATVTFSPAQVVPGSGTSTVTMSVQTTAAMARGEGARVDWRWGLLVAVPLVWRRRRRGVTAAVCVLMLAGCGARTVSPATQESRSYSITVTGTGTNLAGTVVAHSTGVTLVVE